MRKVVLYADAESARCPELIGLDGVDFGSCSWLEVFSDPARARAAALGEEVDEIWAFATDEMSAVNFAAAVKKDSPHTAAFVVASQVSGSLASCAKAAGVDGILSQQGFARRFALERMRRARMADASELSAPVWAERRDSAKKTAPAAGGDGPDMRSAGSRGVDLKASSADASSGFSGARRSKGAFVLAVASGSGGAGKSVATVAAAHAAATCGLDVLMLDCDLQFGDLHHLIREKNPVTLDDVTEDPRILADLAEAARETARPVLVAAPRNLESAEEIACSLAEVIDRAARLFDAVVINTGANWTEHQAIVLERSTSTLFLIDQRASSVRACKHALDLCRRCGIATNSFLFALNRCSRKALLTTIDVSCALQGARVVELREGGEIVEELMGAGYAAELFSIRNDFCASVLDVVEELIPAAGESALQGRSFRGAGWGEAASSRRRGGLRSRLFQMFRSDTSDAQPFHADHARSDEELMAK